MNAFELESIHLFDLQNRSIHFEGVEEAVIVPRSSSRSDISFIDPLLIRNRIDSYDKQKLVFLMLDF